MLSSSIIQTQQVGAQTHQRDLTSTTEAHQVEALCDNISL